jgi:hypothetical protein
VNTTTQDRQIYPSVAANDSGHFLVAWSAFSDQLMNSFDLVGQSYVVSTAIASQGSDATAESTPASGNDAASVPLSGNSQQDFDRSLPISPSGSVVQPRVEISTRGGEKIALSWSSLPGVTYQVQVSTNLISWIDQGPPRVAAGAADAMWVQNGGSTAFFRVIQLR